MKTALYFPLIFFSLILGGAKGLEAKGLDCTVRAKAAVIYNPDSGVFLYKKNFDEPRYPASAMKIATAAYVLHKGLDLKTLCPVSKGAIQVINASLKLANPLAYPAYILEHDGVTVNLKEGKVYSLETLLHAILLMSGNDAANVMAENVSGSIDKFMDEMNAYLRANGIRQTRFQNPHGLHHPAQMTTAYDMAKIGKLAFDHPEFVRIIKAVGYEAEGLLLKNRNPLLKQGKYRYEKVVGGKTGYTKDAGYNLVALAEDKGRRLIVVLMGCTSSEERSEDAISLFEAAFREKPLSRLLFSKDQGPFIHKEKGIKAHLKEDVSMTYYPSEETAITTEIDWYPRVRKKVAGELIVKNEAGVVVARAPLYRGHKRGKTSHHGALIVGGLFCGVGLFLLLKYLKKRSKIVQG